MHDYFLERFASFIEGNNILDVGAGDGESSLFFKKKGFDVLAIDSDSKSCNKINALGINCLNIDIMKFDSGKYNGLVVLHLIHLFPKKDWEKLMDKLKSLLEDEGKLIISVPMKEDDFTELLEKIGFNVLEHQIDSETLASGKKWNYFIVAK